MDCKKVHDLKKSWRLEKMFTNNYLPSPNSCPPIVLLLCIKDHLHRAEMTRRLNSDWSKMTNSRFRPIRIETHRFIYTWFTHHVNEPLITLLTCLTRIVYFSCWLQCEEKRVFCCEYLFTSLVTLTGKCVVDGRIPC